MCNFVDKLILQQHAQGVGTPARIVSMGMIQKLSEGCLSRREEPFTLTAQTQHLEKTKQQYSGMGRPNLAMLPKGRRCQEVLEPVMLVPCQPLNVTC